MTGILARCHGSLDHHAGCYHPGPGILPVWASDLAAGGVVLLLIGGFVAAYFILARRSS